MSFQVREYTSAKNVQAVIEDLLSPDHNPILWLLNRLTPCLHLCLLDLLLLWLLNRLTLCLRLLLSPSLQSSDSLLTDDVDLLLWSLRPWLRSSDSLLTDILLLVFHLLLMSLDLFWVLLAGVNVPSPHVHKAVWALDVSSPSVVAHSLY